MFSNNGHTRKWEKMDHSHGGAFLYYYKNKNYREYHKVENFPPVYKIGIHKYKSLVNSTQYHLWAHTANKAFLEEAAQHQLGEKGFEGLKVVASAENAKEKIGKFLELIRKYEPLEEIEKEVYEFFNLEAPVSEETKQLQDEMKLIRKRKYNEITPTQSLTFTAIPYGKQGEKFFLYHPMFNRKLKNEANFSYIAWGNVADIREANIILLGSYHKDEIHAENAKFLHELYQNDIFSSKGIIAMCESLSAGMEYEKSYDPSNFIAIPVFECIDKLNIPNLHVIGWDNIFTPEYRTKCKQAKDDQLAIWKLEVEERNKSIINTINEYDDYLKNGYQFIIDAGRGHFADFDIVNGVGMKYTAELKRSIKESNYKYVFIVPDIAVKDNSVLVKSIPKGTVYSKTAKYYSTLSLFNQNQTNSAAAINVNQNDDALNQKRAM
ncbi:MAG: hypothetical protein EPO11_10015 [Gammaproteobacteria bacterium]|nr:MAG: hypothetical protein EPO11_10015 [Gammaproteobacteria bacterium]